MPTIKAWRIARITGSEQWSTRIQDTHSWNCGKRSRYRPGRTTTGNRNLPRGYYDRKVKRQRNRKIDREKLRQAVAEKPDAYLRELAKQFDCTAQAVFYMLRKLGITLKKNPSRIARSPRGNARSLPAS